MDEINPVSIAFPNLPTSNTKFISFVSLFDTGSPNSFIRRSALPFHSTGVAQTTQLYGLGGKQIMKLKM